MDSNCVKNVVIGKKNGDDKNILGRVRQCIDSMVAAARHWHLHSESATRRTLSQFWNLKTHRTPFLNYLKLAGLPFLRLSIFERDCRGEHFDRKLV